MLNVIYWNLCLASSTSSLANNFFIVSHHRATLPAPLYSLQACTFLCIFFGAGNTQNLPELLRFWKVAIFFVSDSAANRLPSPLYPFQTRRLKPGVFFFFSPKRLRWSEWAVKLEASISPRQKKKKNRRSSRHWSSCKRWSLRNELCRWSLPHVPAWTCVWKEITVTQSGSDTVRPWKALNMFNFWIWLCSANSVSLPLTQPAEMPVVVVSTCGRNEVIQPPERKKKNHFFIGFFFFSIASSHDGYYVSSELGSISMQTQ